VLILVYGLGYPITAVTTVTISTSVTGYCPNLEVLRYRHQNRFALMNNVAIIPCGRLIFKYVCFWFNSFNNLQFHDEIHLPQLYQA